MSNFEDFDLRRGGSANGRPRPQNRNVNRPYDNRGRSMDLSDEVEMYDEYDEYYDDYDARRPARGGNGSGRRPAPSHPSGGSGPRRSPSRGSAPRGGRSSSGRPNGSRPRSASHDAPSRRPAPSKRSSGKRGKDGKKRKTKRTVIVVEIVLLILLAIFFFLWSKFGKINWDNINMDDINVNSLDAETKKLLEGYTTIALYGVDNREGGKLDSGNSDTIMLVAINNDTKDVKMISVQRDTYLKVSGDSYRKCNSAYSSGGVKQSMEMLNNNLDIEIDGYVSVDFYSLATIVDDLGGLDLEVTQKMVDTKHPNGMNALGQYIGEVEHLLKYYPDKKDYFDIADCTFDKPGTYHMNGAQVVGYCRNRYSVDNDYGRAENQRKVVKLIVEKMKDADLGTINKIADDVFPKVATNLKLSQCITMAKELKNYDMSQSMGFPFTLKGKNLGKKGSVLVPCTLQSNVVELHKFMYGQENYTPTTEVQEISEHIKSETGCTESSAERTQELDNSGQ
ncbi:MAG: LCP family protein [Pseudobutyrivibrio sp.]|nr:LCP family protein [Pseudobutyrivibrio sp.]